MSQQPPISTCVCSVGSTVGDSTEYSLPGSFVHGIIPARTCCQTLFDNIRLAALWKSNGLQGTCREWGKAEFRRMFIKQGDCQQSLLRIHWGPSKQPPAPQHHWVSLASWCFTDKTHLLCRSLTTGTTREIKDRLVPISQRCYAKRSLWQMLVGVLK